MTVQLKTLAVASLLACASYAQADVAFDANLELDTTYTNKVSAPNTNARAGGLDLGGRVEVNAGAKATNGASFVAGRASLLLNNADTYSSFVMATKIPARVIAKRSGGWWKFGR